METLFNDDIENPMIRYFNYIKEQKEKGKPVVGVYCCFAPLEIFWSIDASVAVLCGASADPITAAEEDLPVNICPLVKSSYGYIKTNTCPFNKLSDVVVAETTCDGKKKMFELIQNKKPTYIMELPVMPGKDESFNFWLEKVNDVKKWTEQQFNITITKEMIEKAIKEANYRRNLVLQIYEYLKPHPPYLTNNEMIALNGYAFYITGKAAEVAINYALEALKKRRLNNNTVTSAQAPRILVTGSPVMGATEKVYKIIEESGGIVIVSEACSGIKPLLRPVEEDTGDPIRALARRYFEFPCSVMAMNTYRLEQLDYLIKEFKPDAVVEIVLMGCHTYNIESYIIQKYITREQGLPYVKLETDYSQSDLEQIRTKIQAILETASLNKKFSAKT
ncbi:MAG: double-cubane-cluster-containing anaerobic reductase [Candidatus Hermodarchaeota archaeon]